MHYSPYHVAQRVIYAKSMGWERWCATTKRGASDARLGPLRPLRGSRFALGQPDAFGAGESRRFRRPIAALS